MKRIIPLLLLFVAIAANAATITHHGFTPVSSDDPYTHVVASPSGNGLLTLAVIPDGTFSTATATPSGVWPTWELVHSTTATGDGRWFYTWQGRGTPSAGTITITMGGAGWIEGYHAMVWLDMVSGADNADPVVQADSDNGTSTTPGVTLAAFGSASNATYSFVWVANRTITPGSGFTELAETNNAINFGEYAQSQWRSTNDTTPDASIPSGDDWTFIGFEIREAGGGGGSNAAKVNNLELN